LVRFPPARIDYPEIDAIVASHEDGRLSAVFVNTSRQPVILRATAWDDELASCNEILRLDTGTGGRVERANFDGTFQIDGYGMAVVTNRASSTIID
jgi:hypothetical protein